MKMAYFARITLVILFWVSANSVCLAAPKQDLLKAKLLHEAMVRKYNSSTSFSCTIQAKGSSNVNGDWSSSCFVALQRPDLIFVRRTEKRERQQQHSIRLFICDGNEWVLIDSNYPGKYRSGVGESALPVLKGTFGNQGLTLFEGFSTDLSRGSSSQSLQLGLPWKIRGIPTTSFTWTDSIYFKGIYPDYATNKVFDVAENGTLLRFHSKVYFEQETSEWTEEYFNIAFDRNIPKSLFKVNHPNGFEKVKTFSDY